MECFQMRSIAVLVVSMPLILACEAAVSVDPSSFAVEHQTTHMRGARAGYSTERMGPNGCSEEDVAVYQNNAHILPNGIPTYSVQIINKCDSCTVSDVHISCGEFSSTELVNPSMFQRIGYNDCLVKEGGPLGPGETVSFQYSNSFAYALDVASVSCD